MDDNKIEKELEDIAEKQYLQSLKNINYPNGIINKDDYDRYLYYSSKWKNHVQRKYITKNKKELDLAENPEKINKLLISLKLNEEEKDFIKKINNEIFFLIQKSILYKKRAFGENISINADNNFEANELLYYTPIIIELSGRFYNPEEISQTLIEDMEVTSISSYQIKKVIKDNILKINELRDKFKKDYSDIRLGYKRSRLEELQYLYNTRKNIYANSKIKSKEDEKQLLAILESIKREIQGDLVINGELNVQIEDQASIFIKNQMMKKINISMYILASIAGKLNINPLLLLSRLNNSNYAQFTGYGIDGISSTALTDEISYPSQIIYNWDKIKEANQDFNEENNRLSALPIIQSNQKEQLLSLRDKLKQKLQQSKEPLNKAKENFDMETNN